MFGTRIRDSLDAGAVSWAYMSQYIITPEGDATRRMDRKSRVFVGRRTHQISVILLGVYHQPSRHNQLRDVNFLFIYR